MQIKMTNKKFYDENGFIKIADIFDTRQNPPKLKRTK